jgi:hypothetical protein
MASVPLIRDREKMAGMLVWVLREERHIAETWCPIGGSVALHAKVKLVFATNRG